MNLSLWTIAQNAGLQERGAPLSPGVDAIVDALNICWLTEGVLNMRQAFASVSLASAGLTGEVQWLGRHVTNAGAEEVWAGANNAGTPAMARRSAGVWSTVTISDTLTVADLRYTQSATLNGKLFLAYNSNVNRLHVWDGSSMRRVGISKPSAPTPTNGAGAGALVARRYRVVFLIVSGTDVVATSELSDATASFTPAGANSVIVTRPTTPDSATHWAVYAISGGTDTYNSYKKISSNIAVATTTYDDTTAPASYSGDAPASLGLNIPPPSAKYLLTDGARVLMAGAWESSGATGETTPKANRVWFTRVLGASDLGDDESIPNTSTLKYWIDIGDAGPITGMAGPLYGEIYVFKERSVWKLVPTGDSNAPYARVLVSESAGAVDQRVIAAAEDNGRACLYFADTHALYKLSAGGGLTPIGEGVGRDLRAVSFDAASSLIAYDHYQRILLVQTSTTPTGRTGSYSSFALDTVKTRWSGFGLGGGINGWTLGVNALGASTYLSTGASLRSAVFASTTAGAKRLLIAGQDASSAATITAWGAQCALDGTASFESRTRFRRALSPGAFATFYAPTVWYRNPQGSTSGTLTLTMTYVRQDGVTTSASTTLTPTMDDSGVEFQQVTLEGLAASDAAVLDVLVSLSYSGTAFTSAVTPTIDLITIPFRTQQKVAA